MFLECMSYFILKQDSLENGKVTHAYWTTKEIYHYSTATSLDEDV